MNMCGCPMEALHWKESSQFDVGSRDPESDVWRDCGKENVEATIVRISFQGATTPFVLRTSDKSI